MHAPTSIPLFIYGTLLPGGSNMKVLKQLNCSIEQSLTLPATLCLQLVHSPRHSYPHCRRCKTNATTITGALVHVPQAAWRHLDRFEDVGEEYQRELLIYNNISMWCYIAAAQYQLDDAQIISSGNWLSYWRADELLR